MNTVRTPDTPPWPDWTVTARIASVASALARYRERRATYGHREADSSLNPAIATLRDLAATNGSDADALAKAADHLAAAQRCLDDEWWNDSHAMAWDDRFKTVSTALAAARKRLQEVEGSSVETARAAIEHANGQFNSYASGIPIMDMPDPPAAAAYAAACAAIALAAAELSAASTALAMSAGDGAASAAHAADLAAGLAASLADAIARVVSDSVMTPTAYRARL